MTTTITLDELDETEQGILNFLLEQLAARRERNLLRSAYYDMKHFLGQVGGVIPPQYYKLGIVLGWTGKAVDTLARRCNLDGFYWPDGTLDEIGFRDVWEDNYLGAEVNQGLVSSLIHSTSFIINTKGGDGEPESLIHFKDALNATGEWDPRLRRLTSLLSITEWGGQENKEIHGFALYLDGLVINAQKDAGKWTVDRTTHGWGVPAEPLPYRPRLGRPFGSSRISRAVMSLQDSAARTVIRLEAHSDIYAIPDLWAFGIDADVFTDATGQKLKAWQIMMGRIKTIPDKEGADVPRSSVTQIPASDPDPHLKNLKQQAMLFSGETSIPLTSLGVSDQSNPTSADSYIASREDLIAEAEGATDDWRPALRRAMVRALAIKNGIKADDVPAEWKTIDTKWRSPVYTSRAQAADAGVKQLQAVPWLAETEVALELIGLDDQQIRRALAEKRAAQGAQVLKDFLNRGDANAGQPNGTPGSADQGQPAGGPGSNPPVA
jgi:hypothetical protein